MLVPRNLDWKQVRSFYADLVKLNDGDSIPATPELPRHFKAQKFIREHQHVDGWKASRDAMVELADEYGLSLMSAARLFVDLQKLSSRFAIGKSIESHLRAGDFLKDLEEIRLALERLSNWSSALLDNDRPKRLAIAEKHIENATHFWAKNIVEQSTKDGIEKLLSHGFDIHQPSQYQTEYGGYSVLRQWLRNNVLISELVRTAIEKEYARREHDAANPDPERYMAIPELGEAVKLAGEKLPWMYERFTGNGFSWKTLGDAVTDEGGVKFVRMAMRVMGLEPIGVEAVVKHVKKIRASKAAATATPGNAYLKKDGALPKT